MGVTDQVPKADLTTQPQSPPGMAGGSQTAMRVKGKTILVPSVRIDGRVLVATGKWLRRATVEDEDLVEGESVVDPEGFVSRLKASGFEADILTFGQRLPHIEPKHAYATEWDSLAVVPITSYSDWLQKRVASDVRVAVKKAARLGVIVKEAELDDKFIEGIVRIYNESEYRQGKPFWHYGKDLETVKQINSTYPERSILIGAYYNEELIGFIKMVRVGAVASTLQVIGMKKYSKAKVTTALLAKAVEICVERHFTHLVYGNFIYKDPRSLLTEFKRRNGFEEILVPRYYVPLTLKGNVMLHLKLHKGTAEVLPLLIWRGLSRLRTLTLRYRPKRQRQRVVGA